MRARPGLWYAALSLALALVPGRSYGQGGLAPSGAELTLTLAEWRAEALGRSVFGLAGWIQGSDGDLRWDLTVADGSGPELVPGGRNHWAPLLTRTGRGWTLVAPASGDGVFGVWDREWATPPAGLAALARLVAASAEDRPLRWTNDNHRLTLLGEPLASVEPAPAATGVFRKALARRGRGGGGPGEVVTVGDAAAGGGVRARSSRRPGWVEVTAVERRPVAGSADEVFLPWWSLGELLVPAPAPRAGTSPTGGR